MGSVEERAIIFGMAKKLRKLTKEERVEILLRLNDELRLDSHGGYPSDWMIEDGRVFVADVDDSGRPHLTVQLVDEYLDENESDWKDEGGIGDGELWPTMARLVAEEKDAETNRRLQRKCEEINAISRERAKVTS